MPSYLPFERATLYSAASAVTEEFPIRIYVLDDHPIIGAQLQNMLRAHRDLKVVYVGQSATDLLARLISHPCDLLILDFFLPTERCDGAALLKRIRSRHADLAIVVLSAGNVQHVRHTAYRCGANGYISKTEVLTYLPDLLREVCNAPSTFFHLEDGRLQTGNPEPDKSLLTLSELEIMRLMASGMSVGQLARHIARSKKTVSSHKRRAMKKLGISDDVALAIYLQKHQQSLF